MNFCIHLQVASSLSSVLQTIRGPNTLHAASLLLRRRGYRKCRQPDEHMPDVRKSLPLCLLLLVFIPLFLVHVSYFAVLSIRFHSLLVAKLSREDGAREPGQSRQSHPIRSCSMYVEAFDLH